MIRDLLFSYVKRILLAGFVVSVLLEVYQLADQCRPVTIAADAEEAVVPDLANESLDVFVFLSDRKAAPPSSSLRGASETADHDAYILVGKFEKVDIECSSEQDDIKNVLSLPRHLLQNQTLYMHVLAVEHGQPGRRAARHQRADITRQVVQPDRAIPTRFLLGDADQSSASDDLQKLLGHAPVSSLPKSVEVGFISETRPLNSTALRRKGLSAFVDGKFLRSPLHVNTLISPRDEYTPLVAGAPPPTFEVKLRCISMAMWVLQHTLSQGFDQAQEEYGMNSYDIDSLKQMLGGASIWKMLVVYMIAVLHLIFEYLALSSDISFYREKTSFEGVSSTSVLLQSIINVIMFLYVKEQKNTKFILYFIALRFLLQMWKLWKLTKFESSSAFPFVRWVDRASVDVKGSDVTRKCTVGLVVLLLPTIAAFCAYRLIHHKFRSWYSWIVLSLAICAQVGGFVAMTPQVFMNYQLKSVEHLPWRALTYQAINTFIDDVFVLCIRMPEVQKYSVFRDDIIFFICLGQRWWYRGRKDEEVDELKKVD